MVCVCGLSFVVVACLLSCGWGHVDRRLRSVLDCEPQLHAWLVVFFIGCVTNGGDGGKCYCTWE